MPIVKIEGRGHARVVTLNRSETANLTDSPITMAPRSAIPILEKGHSEWVDNSQMRDYALSLSRLAAACAAAGELEQACAAAEEAMALARGWLVESFASVLEILQRG